MESFNLLASIAACNQLVLKCADISNAYFQGEKMDRLLLLRPPRGGLPGEEDSGYMLVEKETHSSFLSGWKSLQSCNHGVDMLVIENVTAVYSTEEVFLLKISRH